jgi:hypothetical protein
MTRNRTVVDRCRSTNLWPLRGGNISARRGPRRTAESTVTSRLSTVAIDLVHQMEGLSGRVLRRVAAESAALAVARTQLIDPRLEAALQALNASGAQAPATQRIVGQLTNELDEVAWHIRDLVEVGAASQDAYEEAFRKARAAAAVGYALDPDPRASAFEAVYEAQAAVVDLAAVRMAVAFAIASEP